MPRFTHPIWWQIAQPDPAGPRRIRMIPRMEVLVRTRTGRWVPVRVLVDTGSSFSLMPTVFAREWRLPVPAATSRVNLLTATGPEPAVVRDAAFAVRFPRLPELTFDLLWLLRDDLPLDAPALLGLHNTVDLLTVTLDGTPRPDGLMGGISLATRDA